MKRIAFLIFAGLFVALSQGNAQQTYRMTLEECLQYAMGNSYTREATKLNEEAREDSYQQSKNERLPTLNASAGETLSHRKGNEAEWSGSLGASSNVVLFQGGTVNNSIEQSELQLEQTRARSNQYDNQLTIDILQAFLAVLGNEELLRYQQEVLTASEAQRLNGEVLLRAENIIESDYLLLVSQYESDKNSIIETEITRNNSLLDLKNLMSMDPNIDLQIVYPDSSMVNSLLLLPSEETVVQRSMNTLPDVQISEYNVQIAETGLKISKAGHFPTLSLGGSIGTGHTEFSGLGSQLSDRRNESIGLSLSIPIFNRGRTRSNVTQSKIALRQAELDNQQTLLNLQQTIMKEHRNVISSRSRYQASEVRELAYRKSFEAYRVRFEAGTITTVELLQQQNNYINALNEYIQGKYGFILRRKILDVYMGEPITM